MTLRDAIDTSPCRAAYCVVDHAYYAMIAQLADTPNTLTPYLFILNVFAHPNDYSVTRIAFGEKGLNNLAARINALGDGWVACEDTGQWWP